MSSVPPNMPPGGGVPPYDPKTQWRAYREQQKVAWRAQRDAWHAQQHAWKAQYKGVYAPRVPSVVGPVLLIAIGVMGLLMVLGRIDAASFWTWYGRWWPVLLIAAGLALLGEWALDMKRKTPVRRSGSFIGILALVALLGIFAAGWNHIQPFAGHWNSNGDDFFNAFGLPEHDQDQPVISQQIPANATITINNPRGDVSVTSSEGTNLEVQAHQIAYANTDGEAGRIFDAEKATVNVSGTAAIVQSNGNDHGRVNLTVTVPRTAKVMVNAGKGDVTAASLGTGIGINAAQGDTRLDTINGPVTMRFSSGRHNFSAHDIAGDVNTSGSCNDVTLSGIKGRLQINGEIYGEVHIENTEAQVNIHTSVTDLQVASLPGDLTLNSDNLRMIEARGPVRVTTHSKDVDLSQIYGDISVENRNGTISVAPAGSYSVEARNDKGDIELVLTPDVSASINGRTHNGEIVTEYALTVTGQEDKTVGGRIGSGTARITLNTSNGDLHIKKGPAFPAAPATPKALQAPSAPNAPAASAGKHLKSSKTLPQQPETR
jgi:DUF4097 and DUF4098 domain-containing protein YvlB